MKKILYVHGLGGGANGRVSGLIADNIGDGYIGIVNICAVFKPTKLCSFS